MSHVSVIGAGSWGTTLAYLLSQKGIEVSLWVYEKDLAEEMGRTRINKIYLPHVTLPKHMKISHQMMRTMMMMMMTWI